MRAYVDSDILIWHLRGEPKAARLLRRLSAEQGTDLWIGALQRAEVVFFMRRQDVAATRTFLSRFKTESVTQSIVDQAGEFYRTWHRRQRRDTGGDRRGDGWEDLYVERQALSDA